MAPYSDFYKSPTPPADGPVTLTMQAGRDDTVLNHMDWEHTSDAVEAVRELRGAGMVDTMAVDLPWEVWDATVQNGIRTTVVLDTNILIGYLPLLRSLVNQLKEIAQPSLLGLLCPVAVFRELDALKHASRKTTRYLLQPDPDPITTIISRSRHETRNDHNLYPTHTRTQEVSIGALSREATKWLLEEVDSPNRTSSDGLAYVKGQRAHESLIPLQNGRRNAGSNDDEILDACLYWRRNLPAEARVVLISDDRNLCLKSRVENIITLSLDDSFTLSKLLASLDPLLSSLPAQLRITPYTKSHVSASSPFASPKTPPRNRSSQSSSSKSPLTTPAPPRPAPPSPKPIPPPTEHSAMELDYAIHMPTLIPPPPLPSSWTSTTPLEVLERISQTLTNLLTIRLFKHVFEYLKHNTPEEHEIWTVELGNPTNDPNWSGEELMAFVRRWWVEASIRELCERGLDIVRDARTGEEEEESLSPAQIQIPELEPSCRSRWASSSPPPRPRPRPAKPLPPPRTGRPTLSPHSYLQTIQSSLTPLTTWLSFLNAPPLSPPLGQWSVPKVEIMLEHLEGLLNVLLAGFLGTYCGKEVRMMVWEWEERFRVVGVGVGTTG